MNSEHRNTKFSKQNYNSDKIMILIADKNMSQITFYIVETTLWSKRYSEIK